MSVNRLTQEVRWLGGLLGDVIRRLEGDEGFALEEKVRALSKLRRRGDQAAARELIELVRGLTIDDCWLVCRAFSIFFDLTNLAEDRHRVRTLRERELHQSVRPESLASAVQDVRSRGLSPEQVQEILHRLSLQPVFTAHPTEAKRRAVRNALRRIRRWLNHWEQSQGQLPSQNDCEPTAPARPAEQRRLQRKLMEELEVLWLTDPLLSRRPTVLEEVDRGMYFMTSLWRVLPRLHRDLKDALGEAYPGHEFEIPSFVRFGTWMGGDRDGNPFVTAQVTAETLRRLRRRALRMHARQAGKLIRKLTHSELRIAASSELKQSLEQAQWQWPQLNQILEPLSPHEVYRRYLALIEWRLQQSLRELKAGGVWPGAYHHCSELEAELECLRRSLLPHRHSSLEDWLVQLRTFGFHLAALDLRQEAQIYNRALAEGDEETFSLFRLINWAVERYGPECLGCHILSMTHSSQDILNLLQLQTTYAPLVKMPLVPLFETINDLQRGPEILAELFENPNYRDYLRGQGDRQVVMIGYSDSTKDGGYLAANWALYAGQRRMLETAKKYGISLQYFHGRGGALGRGGGPAARSILSLPPGSTDAGMRLTEQGEVLSARYDDPLVAQRHLEQLTWALFQAQLGVGESEFVDLDFDQLSARSLERYRELVQTPGFIEFFRQATPIQGIEQLQIGSRPSRRAAGPAADLSGLRAIPWVFSWTQNRVLLPAWYGLGTALEDVPPEKLRAAYRAWPFFTAVVDNAVLALAKADFGIVQEYTQAVESPQVRQLLWDKLNREYQLTLQVLLTITEQTELLDDLPWLKRSIQVRNPYVDPMNFVQIETLRRLRAGEDEELHRNLLRMTIQGIAGGLRTTG